MPDVKPDMDLLALAGFTKQGLREVDSSSVGGSPHADKIDIKELAGLSTPMKKGMAGGGMLSGLDFLEMPKSNPSGRVDMDGVELPPVPTATTPEFMPVPEEMRDRVYHDAAYINPTTDPTQAKEDKLPQLTTDGFDLFQHAIVKQILKHLDDTIATMDKSLTALKKKRKHIVSLLIGDVDGKR